MLKDCPCNGLNDKCFRCNGSGVYEVNEEGNIIKGSLPATKDSFYDRVNLKRRNGQLNHKGITKQRIETIYSVWTICPLCGIIVKHLSHHLNKVHNNIKELSIQKELYQNSRNENNQQPKINNDSTSNVESIVEDTALSNSSQKKRFCPFCKSFVTDYIKHFNEKHKEEVMKEKYSSDCSSSKLFDESMKNKMQNFHQPFKTNRQFRICPKCNQKILEKNFKKHMKKVHSSIEKRVMNTEISQEQTTLKVNKPRHRKRKNFVKCPICNVLVLYTSLKDHITLTHKKIETIKKNTDYCISLKKKRIIETKIDGSKGWHTFRDHGQFGSYPSFDPMDDESKS